MMIGIRPGLSVPTIRESLPPPPVALSRPLSAPPEASETEPPSIATQPQAAEENTPIKWWSKGSFSFKDILDMLNPLQHLPVISTLYRKLTGETLGGVARIIGGAIYGRAGGIASMISSVANAVFGAITGKDMGERIYAAIFGEPKGDKTADGGAATASLLAAVAKSKPVTYQPELSASAPGAAQRAGKPDFVQVASAIDVYENIAPACAAPQRILAREEPEESGSFVRRSRFED
jgi:hypothetical protein